MASILFGLACALVWGAADFSGGIASKRTNEYGVVICAEYLGMVLVAALAWLTGEALPPWQTWVWSGFAGLGAGFGLMLLYRALAGGRMSVAAPVSALIGACFPVVVGAFMDGLPGFWTLAGILLALVAVWLIAGGGGKEGIALKELGLPLAAGLLFGVFFVGMHLASQGSFFWSITSARFTAASSLLIYALVTHQPWKPAPKHWALIALSGVLDVTGNGFYMLSAHGGRIDITAVISSLYPGSTVLLARLVLKERIARLQMVGILIALAAIALMAV